MCACRVNIAHVVMLWFCWASGLVSKMRHVADISYVQDEIWIADDHAMLSVCCFVSYLNTLKSPHFTYSIHYERLLTMLLVLLQAGKVAHWPCKFAKKPENGNCCKFFDCGGCCCPWPSLSPCPRSDPDHLLLIVTSASMPSASCRTAPSVEEA